MRKSVKPNESSHAICVTSGMPAGHNAIILFQQASLGQSGKPLSPITIQFLKQYHNCQFIFL